MNHWIQQQHLESIPYVVASSSRRINMLQVLLLILFSNSCCQVVTYAFVLNSRS